MGKKIISAMTLFFYVVLLISCTSTSLEKKKLTVTPDDPAAKSLTILGVQTSSGDYIEILKDPPARINQTHVQAYRTKKVTVSKSEVKNVSLNNRGQYEIETQDGKRYLGVSTRRDQFICHEYISIPIAEITLLWFETVNRVKKVNAFKTIALVLGVGALALTTAGSKDFSTSII